MGLFLSTYRSFPPWYYMAREYLKDPKEDDEWRLKDLISSAVFLMVFVMLIANLAALFLSIPHVVSNVPDTYESGIVFEEELPFYPSSSEEMTVEVDSVIEEGRAFFFEIGYAGNRRPYTDPWVSFNGPTKEIYRLGTGNSSGSWTSGSVIPGLNPGVWGVELLFGPRLDRARNIDTGISISIVNTSSGWIKPDLPPDLTVADGIPFSLVGSAQDPDDFKILIDGQGKNLSSRGEDGYWLGIGNVSHGWHRLTVTGNLTDSSDYLFYLARGEGLVTPSVTMKRLSTGYDQAFEEDIVGEELDGPVEYRLSVGRVYELRARFPDSSSVTNDLPEDMLSGVHSPRLLVEVGERTYPMMSMGFDNLSYRGHIVIPGNPDDEDSPRILPEVWGSFVGERSLEVVYEEDHLPKLDLDPDPWSREGLTSGENSVIEISSGPYQLGYRRFTDEPEARLDGEGVSGRIELEYEENSSLPSYSGVIPADVTGSGATLSVRGNVTFQYYEIPTLAVPFPPFFMGIGPVLFGWEAVAWFAFIFVSIVASSYYLFHRDYFGSSGDFMNRAYSFSRDPQSDSNRTFWTFLGIIFFSLIVVVMFNLMKQETPGLSILSDEVPVWYRMMILSNASVWEEVTMRLFLLGIPLFIIRSFSREGYRSGFEAISRRGWRFRELLGGSGRFDVWSVSLILLTAGMFGFAHLGWGVWKVLPTFASGLLFGYLFVRVGLHGAIVVHFLIDYSSFLQELVGFGSLLVWVVYMLALLSGSVFLAVVLVEIIHKTLDSYEIKKPNPALYLVVHSLLSVLLGIFLLINDMATLSILFLQAPLSGVITYVLERVKLFFPAYVVNYLSSVMTMALAPFGLAWTAAKWDEIGGPFTSNGDNG